MKICYIGDGESVHNHFMVEWFLRNGHDILFLTDTPEEFPFPHVQQQVASRHGGGPFRHLYAGYQTRRWIQTWRPDIVHAHNVTGYGYWGAMSGFSPLVMTAWGSDLNIIAQKNPLLRYIIESSLGRANLITCDAEDLCQTARELSHHRVDTRLLQWGIDFQKFHKEPNAEYRDWIRGGRELVFLSTRRLRPVYNIDTVIKAYAEALPHLPSSRLVVSGDDTDKPALEKLARDLNLTEHILFTGWLPREKLIDTMLSADVFISVPGSDSTALSLLEAFAARLPVIISDLPANHEWIQPGGNGLLVTPGDVQLLSQAMLSTANDSARNARWAEMNYTAVQERGDREKEMKRLESWYRELIETT